MDLYNNMESLLCLNQDPYSVYIRVLISCQFLDGFLLFFQSILQDLATASVQALVREAVPLSEL